jgi:hypothetical protein
MNRLKNITVDELLWIILAVGFFAITIIKLLK